MTSRHYCWTAYDYDRLDPSVLEEAPVRYVVYQIERCPDTDRLHAQGYIELTRPVRRKAVQNLLTPTAHVEPRRGTREQARNYCMKEDSRHSAPVEIGEFDSGGQGVRNDIHSIVAIVREGGIRAAYDHAPGTYARYYRGIWEARHMAVNDVERKISVEFNVARRPSGAYRLLSGETDRERYHGYRGESTIYCSYHQYEFLRSSLVSSDPWLLPNGVAAEWRRVCVAPRLVEIDSEESARLTPPGFD